MINVALFEPEIPPNTGNIARLCAATETPLHIVGEPSFRMDAAAVRRAGLDYWPHVNLTRHENFDEFIEKLNGAPGGAPRIICLTTKAKRSYTDWEFAPDDYLLFGPETRGLPAEILDTYKDTCLTIPMASPHVRSLNLANAVSIVMYEALRQLQ